MLRLFFLFLSTFCFSLSADDAAPNFLVENEEKIPGLPEEISPLEKATSSYESAFIKMIFALVVILLLAGLAVYFFKKFSISRMQHNNHFRNIKILEKRSLSPKTVLYLVEIGGKKILMGESQLEIRTLSNLEWIETEKKTL